MDEILKIKEKIFEDAKSEADTNLKQAKKEAEEIIESAEKDAEEKKQEILRKAKKDAELRRIRLIKANKLQSKKRKLEIKQNMINEAFSAAVDKLNELPVEDYENMLIDMIVKRVSTGKEEIILSEKDRERLGTKFTDKVNSILKSKGIDADLKLSGQNGNFNGGFILRSGNIDLNNTFEALIRMNREEIEKDVVSVLFN